MSDSDDSSSPTPPGSNAPQPAPVAPAATPPSEAPPEVQQEAPLISEPIAPEPTTPGLNLPLYATAVSLLAGGALLYFLLRTPAPAPVSAPERAELPSPSVTSAASAPPLTDAPRTSDSLAQELRAAMHASRQSKVVYDDILGEGPGNWDPQPRYPEGTVNCIVWVTQVIAEGYLPHGTPAERTSLLDELRYFDHTVSFGHRKHYLAHQLALSPAPFVAVDDGVCAPDAKDHVRLDFMKFKRSHHYSCPLYREGVSDLRYPYVSGRKFLSCAPKLAPGVYVLFGVATEKYHRVYGKDSGPLGLVHGMFLDVRSPTDIKIWHASTAIQKVRDEELGVYVKRMTESMHKGYALYRLDPTWNWKTAPASEWKSASACEQRLKPAPQ